MDVDTAVCRVLATSKSDPFPVYLNMRSITFHFSYLQDLFWKRTTVHASCSPTPLEVWVEFQFIRYTVFSPRLFKDDGPLIPVYKHNGHYAFIIIILTLTVQSS